MPSAYFDRSEQITPSDSDYLTAAKYTKVESPQEVEATSVTVASDIITKASNGLANGDIIDFTDLGTVTGIDTGVEYFVVGVSGNDFSASETFQGTAINLTGANTTPPTYRKLYDFAQVRQNGYIMAGGAGNIVALPAGHMDTDDDTVQPLGAQSYTVVAGQILPGQFKKVFESSTATDMVLLFVSGE